MKKPFELLYITGCPGSYTAHLYNREKGYFTEKSFLWYSKREMIYKLRNEYGVVCPVGTY